MRYIGPATVGLVDYVASFRKTHVWVIGDVLLDTYTYGVASRISPEGPVPVIELGRQESRLGGAGNAAANCTRLGARCHLFSVIGSDLEGQKIQALGAEAGIDCTGIIIDESRSTSTKQRIMSGMHQIARLDTEVTSVIGTSVERKLVSELSRQAVPDAIIISDYAKGVVTTSVMDAVRKLKPRPLVVVDPKRSNFLFYKGCDFIKPNRLEAARAIGCSPSNLFEGRRLERILKAMPGTEMIVTCGVDGMSWIKSKGERVDVPTNPQQVFDVSGAGDTASAALTLSLVSGAPIMGACWIANVAAGVAVSHAGTYAVTQAELLQTILSTSRSLQSKLMNLSVAQSVREAMRSGGRTVVLTNGCFDLLHPGHVHLLATASGLGDFLFVAVNSDASVRRLKGDLRPIMTLNERVALLSAFPFTGAVVSFDEDTPVELIRILQPDILVKGDQYRMDEVVGADFVQQNGGKVDLVRMIPNCSTTDIVERIIASFGGVTIKGASPSIVPLTEGEKVV